MVDRGADHDPRAAPALDGGGQAEHAEGVGLGPAAGQHDLLAGAAHQGGDAAPGDLDKVPGCPPSAWIEEGFPISARAAVMAARAAGISGAVALKSR